jgi:hypothetical protein
MVVLLALAGCEEAAPAPRAAPAVAPAIAAAVPAAEPAWVAEPARVAGPARVDAAEPEPVDAPAAEPEPAPAGLPPLSAEERAALLAGPEERIISHREHFTVSNEYRHDLWFPYLRGLGGAYVGVASDQNYTLMAVARSEVAYLLDLDRQVVRLHRVYMALIAASPEPDLFLARFDEAARDETRAVIAAGLSDMSERDREEAQRFVDDNRAALREYLGAVRTNRRGEQGVTWLSDPELYAYIRQMVAGGRLRPINGNLTGKTAMATIAASARGLGLAVKLLYLSNAEEYLFYTPEFVANVRGLPGAADSVVLRTIHDRFVGWESSGDGDRRWNYQVQPLLDFQGRLAERKNTARTAMLERATTEGAISRVTRGVSVFKPVGGRG